MEEMTYDFSSEECDTNLSDPLGDVAPPHEILLNSFKGELLDEFYDYDSLDSIKQEHIVNGDNVQDEEKLLMQKHDRTFNKNCVDLCEGSSLEDTVGKTIKQEIDVPESETLCLNEQDMTLNEDFVGECESNLKNTVQDKHVKVKEIKEEIDVSANGMSNPEQNKTVTSKSALSVLRDNHPFPMRRKPPLRTYTRVPKKIKFEDEPQHPSVSETILEVDLDQPSTSSTALLSSIDVCEDRLQKGIASEAYCIDGQYVKYGAYMNEDQKMYRCVTCGGFFQSKDELEEHETFHNAKVMHMCIICRQMYDNCNELLDHANIHSNYNNECSECGQCFNSTQKFTEHVSVHKGSLRIQCLFCVRHFVSFAYAIRHMKSHKNLKKGRTCKLCGAFFVKHPDMEMHITKHT